MVSFWPWKGDDNSPASFEKTLSDLSTKIARLSNRLDGLRQRSRHLKVLWTLYAGFTYLFCTIILILVVGWRKWRSIEYTAVAGGPIIIYLFRLSLTTYYEYRISTIQSHLDRLQKQRDSTIEKLKAATKYNDTQDLLKKYSGTPTPKTKPAAPSERKTTQKQGDGSKVGRTPFVPPPTANIPGRNGTLTFANTPQHSALQVRNLLGQDAHRVSGATPSTHRPVSSQSVSADFAPNAFSAAPQYSQVNEGSRWYDRITDVLLGEDETLPRARLALICDNCRLVNGQAPPGVKRLEDVGKWRCGGCGAMNGEESETKKVVASIKEQAYSELTHIKKGEESTQGEKHHDMNGEDAAASQEDGRESEIAQYSSESSDSVDRIEAKGTNAVEPENPRRRSTRSNRGGKKAT